MNNNNNNNKFKLNHAGNLIIIGFLAAILGMSFLVYKSVGVKFELSEKGDYYSLETHYNQLVEAKATANKLGESFSLNKKDGKITLQIPNEIASRIETGSIFFFCYSDAEKDITVDLLPNDSGRYIFNEEELLKGHNYNAKIHFIADGIEYYKEQRFY